MKTYIASDRIGYELKTKLTIKLVSLGFEVNDIGPYRSESVHYPAKAFEVAEFVLNNQPSFGILICSSGIGMAIAANKIKGIRAANCNSLFLAQQARMHNDANILCIGSDVSKFSTALKIVLKFSSTQFQGGKHVERIEMINNK